MPGSKQAAQKAVKTNRLKNPDYYKQLGREGGMKRNPNKGFGFDKQRAVEAGRKGAAKRWGKS